MPQIDHEKALRICETVNRVPVGKVSSYGFIADLAGLPGRARMVGSALRQVSAHQNVAWHRIIRADGRLAFASGSDAAHRQTEMLRREGVVVVNGRVDLTRYRWQPELAELLQMNY
jgi:methylated-DNA-protein-cysteine methyltransferase-like protein